MVHAILKAPEFELRSFEAVEWMLMVFLGKGLLTFIRDTRWVFRMDGGYLKIVVNVVDCSGINYLRAQSERMKMEAMMLLRLINERLPIEEQFFI